MRVLVPLWEFNLYWQDQQGNYWPIPYLNLALAPISLWEHDEALRRLKVMATLTKCLLALPKDLLV